MEWYKIGDDLINLKQIKKIRFVDDKKYIYFDDKVVTFQFDGKYLDYKNQIIDLLTKGEHR